MDRVLPNVDVPEELRRSLSALPVDLLKRGSAGKNKRAYAPGSVIAPTTVNSAGVPTKVRKITSSAPSASSHSASAIRPTCATRSSVNLPVLAPSSPVAGPSGSGASSGVVTRSGRKIQEVSYAETSASNADDDDYSTHDVGDSPSHDPAELSDGDESWEVDWETDSD
jgi:hypothetical protein